MASYYLYLWTLRKTTGVHINTPMHKIMCVVKYVFVGYIKLRPDRDVLYVLLRSCSKA